MTKYCSKECQKAHWKEHKKKCASNANAKTLIDSLPNGEAEQLITNTCLSGKSFPVANESFARSAGLDDNGMANLRDYESRAAAGDAQVQYELGCSAHMIEAINASIWLRLAAEQGHTKAQYNLGCAYKRGEGVSIDHEQSARWFRAAAEQGHMEAQCNLGLSYCKGQGVQQSYAEAKGWLEKAAAQGDTLAQVELRKVAMALATQARGHVATWSGREADTGFE